MTEQLSFFIIADILVKELMNVNFDTFIPSEKAQKNILY